MSEKKAISAALTLIFKGIKSLQETFPNRKFTIDGRLVGDIGEVIAALEYDLILDDVSRPVHDATTSQGWNVQIKATFKDSLTFRTVPDYYLGFKLNENGSFEAIFNGPGNIIYERYKHRNGIGTKLLSFPITELRRLNDQVPLDKRIPKKT